MATISRFQAIASIGRVRASGFPAWLLWLAGPGTIGPNWATHYLAHGCDVVATDPAPGAENASARTSGAGIWGGPIRGGFAVSSAGRANVA
jgi:hypothetical protein